MPALPATSRTRYADLPVWAARGLFLALLLLIGFGLTHPPTVAPTGQPGNGDATLYRAIADRMARGQDYYHAAAAEQRYRAYPVAPATAIRPPLLAEIEVRLGPDGAEWGLRLLGLATAMAMVILLAPMLRAPTREAAILLAATSGGLLLQPGMWVWHEAWAGMLVALALAVRSERRWGGAIVLGLAAALVRELAFPLLPVMAGVAWIERRRKEAVGWAVATGCALAAFAVHAILASAVVQKGDVISPGWLALGGWPFDLALARESAVLLALPPAVTAAALPLALLGWAAMRSGMALRVAALLGIWLTAFLFVGRPDNGYWGFLLSGLIPPGIALALPALRDLAMAAVPLAPRRHSGETGADPSLKTSNHVHPIRPLDPRAGDDQGDDRAVRRGAAA